MLTHLLRIACLVIAFSSCVTISRNNKNTNNKEITRTVNMNAADVEIPAGITPDSLTNLPRTQDGGFVLAPGYYEAEFKTFCLQPGTPDPSKDDAYLMAPLMGYRKDYIETVLYSSRSKPYIEQKNVQLLLWSIVSGSDYDKLSPAVRSDANRLLTSKQIFELRGGMLGLIKTVSNNIPVKGNSDVKRLFDMGTSSYEAFEKIAVLPEPSQKIHADFKNDQWYRQEGNYFVRYYPVSYKKVRIQVYVPANVLDSTGKVAGEYLVFDPTGSQVIPANSNAQRLGVGGTILDIIKEVIIVNRKNIPPPTSPSKKTKKRNPDPKTTPDPPRNPDPHFPERT